MKKSLIGISAENLKELIASLKQPAFRAKQLHEWIYRKLTTDFSQMTNLPATMRQSLEQSYTVIPFTIKECLKSKDGTEKFVLECLDGKLIETVYIPSAKRRTVCISTQVGCPVKCSFCASGRNGLERNLTAAEIAGQVLFIAARFKAMPTNIVVMGMGEPLLNPHTEEGLALITSPDFLGLGARHITVSTSGIVPGIKKLADAGYQWNLAVSVHAPEDILRSRIIPDKCRYPLTEIMEACRYYREKTGRKVTFEYTLVNGENDSKECARKLAALAKSVDAKINLIPLNPTDLENRRPQEKELSYFVAQLENCGVTVTVRNSRGDEIAAACGQLKNRVENNKET